MPSLDVFALKSPFDELYGFKLLTIGSETATAEVSVTDHHRQPFGLVHGGVFASIAETLASFATAAAVVPDGKICMGLSNQTSFVRPVTAGTVHATATRKHAGRTTWIWEIEMSDDSGNLCALSRMTIAVREAP